MILERLPGSRHSRVVPSWKDRAAVLIAGGPSLTPEQVHEVRIAREADRFRVVVVNDAYLLAPWADAHYAADGKWHAWHEAGVAKPLLGLSAEDVRAAWRAFPGEKCSIEWGGERVKDERVHVLKNLHDSCHGYGLSTNPERLVTGRNSGFQALNLVILAGVSRVILLGYDGGAAPGGATHWHGGHPKPSSDIFDKIRASFSAVENELAAMGVAVVNCSPGSQINAFPKARLADALHVEPAGAAA